jgi:hypothetical protein
LWIFGRCGCCAMQELLGIPEVNELLFDCFAVIDCSTRLFSFGLRLVPSLFGRLSWEEWPLRFARILFSLPYISFSFLSSR